MQCYLIHLSKPLGSPLSDAERAAYGLPPRKTDRPHTAQHYIGCTYDLTARLKEHACGQGSALLAHARELGISWIVARVWDGDWALERALKGRKNAAKLCPICQKEKQHA
ncbi:MAG TPA: hypothetical protein VF813_00680 [Anaerolineaceae bacterium]